MRPTVTTVKIAETIIAIPAILTMRCEMSKVPLLLLPTLSYSEM